MSVYALHDPRTGKCRYVGRSASPSNRLNTHCSRAHSTALRDWVTDLRAAGLKPEMRLLDGGTEREWIIRLSPDLNVMSGADDDGGDAVALSIRFPRAIYDRAHAAAGEDDRTLNSYVVRAIREKLDRDEDAKKRR